MREVVNKRQDCVAVEQQPLTGTTVRDIGQLVGRDVQLLRQNLPVAVGLIEHIDKVAVLENVRYFRACEQIFHVLRNRCGQSTPFTKTLPNFNGISGGLFLFQQDGLPAGGSDGSGEAGIDYTVPAEALTDEEFSKIYAEAKKYVGTPYVWGGSSPDTGFDCSGYVCWVYNQNGYNVGRTTANGLWNKCQHISEAEAKPGDLVFFEGTYDTPGKSHVGIVRPVRTIVEVEKGGCG